MKEYTITYTADMTFIFKDEDDFWTSEEIEKNMLKQALRDYVSVYDKSEPDDIKIRNLKIFERELD